LSSLAWRGNRKSGGNWTGSDAEALATLGTAARNHFATVLGCHAGTETMGPFALEVTRLKGSFHGDGPVQGCECRNDGFGRWSEHGAATGMRDSSQFVAFRQWAALTEKLGSYSRNKVFIFNESIRLLLLLLGKRISVDNRLPAAGDAV
jgi:hypothetical protein